MPHHKNILLPGPNHLPILTDIFLPENPAPAPVIIYAHGFNGFKDWGNFDLIAAQFAAAGFAFIKFNFSHNGTTPQQPEDFADLAAYAENNYTKQLADLHAVTDWACSAENPFAARINKKQIGLIGHSLGGGISIIHASEDARIKALVTWAAVAECQTPWGKWPIEKLAEWQETGVACTLNSRTGQQLPLHYQLFENYAQNKERLSIRAAAQRLMIPWLICHGTVDTSVPFNNAEQLKAWQPSAEIFSVNSDHVFGRKHPWAAATLPGPMLAVNKRTLDFFKAVLV